MFLLDYCQPHLGSNNLLDTDSSLPPLLILAVSLLLFAWASIAFAARRRRSSLLALLDYAPAPGIGILRAVSASAAGISIATIGAGLVDEWPIAALLLGSLSVAAVSLVTVHFLSDRWAALFPGTARRIMHPQRWFSAAPTTPSGGDAPASNGPNSADHANGDIHAESSPLTPAEILNLDNYDIDMVRSISRMDDRDVLDIMVPRLDVYAVPFTASFPEVIEAFVAGRHTRLPVYNDTMDNIVGILHISDILNALANNQTHAGFQSLMREPEFVAENMPVDDLLHLMRSNSLQMAIVVDEYGGVEGMVTLEDVLEEIVGEIDDEFAVGDADSPIPEDGGSWLVSATAPVEVVVRSLGIQLEHSDVNTIGGYVYTQLGRMAAVGDVVTNDAVSIEVTEVRGRRIRQLRLTADAVAGDVVNEVGKPAP